MGSRPISPTEKALFADWLAEFDEGKPLHLEVTAAQTLTESQAAGEV